MLKTKGRSRPNRRNISDVLSRLDNYFVMEDVNDACILKSSCLSNSINADLNPSAAVPLTR